MMWLREPSESALRYTVQKQARGEFSYAEVGATRNEEAPKGYAVARERIQLGEGEQAWEKARWAVTHWKMFQLDWVKVCWSYQRIEPGSVVGVLVFSYWLWSLNPAKIVYVVDEEEPVRRYGFGYGTLEGHMAQGEEQFLIEMLEDGTVWYELYSFSKPRHKLARWFSPLAKRVQRRFARQSLQAMFDAVNKPPPKVRIRRR
ncbi:MAG: DUF1990 domain-containing protein [Acidimicrobiia bacterium]|nr:DUF1990 domain-containing protein [Acidimicrobiia bacterium]